MKKEEIVKSRKRVKDHGEVFTAAREVSAMLELVKQETDRIESRFLEPACGTGNFLAEVFKLKLIVVERRYKQNQLDFERNSVTAISSLYGIDILKDNLEECRDRLFSIFNDTYSKLFSSKCKEECKNSIRFILDKNILWGDALTLKRPEHPAYPIIFSEWSPINKNMVKRRDFTMANLLNNQPVNGLNLFSDLGDMAFIPTPIKDYPLMHFLKLANGSTSNI